MRTYETVVTIGHEIAAALLCIAGSVAGCSPGDDNDDRPADRAGSTVRCEFATASDKVPVPGPAGNRFVADLRIRGTLENGGDRMFSLVGTANWEDRGAMSGAVRGNVFLAEDGSVEGFSLYVDHRGFAAGGLRIATLDQRGSLSPNAARAFLFLLPQERLSRPVDYACRVDAP